MSKHDNGQPEIPEGFLTLTVSNPMWGEPPTGLNVAAFHVIKEDGSKELWMQFAFVLRNGTAIGFPMAFTDAKMLRNTLTERMLEAEGGLTVVKG